MERRRAVADRIRDYWRKNQGVSLAERWYRTLADEVATPAEWLQAAGNIVQHENVQVIPGSTAFGQTVTTPLPPGARPKLRGEVLREKKDPSVTELMAMLQQSFPKSQMMVCGVLGPKSNAHGPNEFLHVPYGKKLTAAVAQVIAATP